MKHKLIEFNIPENFPNESQENLKELQLKLDAYVQTLLGDRNPSKRLGSPLFTKDGPQVRNYETLDGGYAELSPEAGTSWELAIYQLAHETVHLLDPRPGPPSGKGSNWLEEGVAVEFSLHVADSFGFSTKTNDKKYKTARQMVRRLGGDVFLKVRELRKLSGHLADVSKTELKKYAPQLPDQVAEKLTSQFIST